MLPLDWSSLGRPCKLRRHDIISVFYFYEVEKMARKKTILKQLESKDLMKVTKAKKGKRRKKPKSSKPIEVTTKSGKTYKIKLSKPVKKVTKKSIAKHQQDLKIAQIKRGIKKAAAEEKKAKKDRKPVTIKYGKKVFKSKAAAEKYLERVLVNRALKGEKELKKQYLDINKRLKTKLDIKKDAYLNEDIKNLRSLFPKGIQIDPRWSEERIKKYLNEVINKSTSLSKHSLFSRLNSISSKSDTAFDGFLIADNLSKLMDNNLLDAEELAKLDELINKLYDLMNLAAQAEAEGEEFDLKGEMEAEIKNFIDWYLERHPEEEDNKYVLSILNEVNATIAETE